MLLTAFILILDLMLGLVWIAFSYILANLLTIIGIAVCAAIAIFVLNRLGVKIFKKQEKSAKKEKKLFKDILKEKLKNILEKNSDFLSGMVRFVQSLFYRIKTKLTRKGMHSVGATVLAIILLLLII